MSSRWITACFLIVGACGTDSGGADAGDAGVVVDATTSDAGDASASDADCGPTFQCCTSCDDDTPTLAVCMNGKRVCPSGKPQSELVCPCYSIKCTIPPYHADCVACDGGTAPSTCDVDANVFVCPAGMHSVDALDASCD